MLLRVVGSCCAKFETLQTFIYVEMDVTTPNNVGSCWPTMLRPGVCTGLYSNVICKKLNHKNVVCYNFSQIK